MNFLDRLRFVFGGQVPTKENPVGRSVVQYVQGLPIWTPDDYAQLAEETYRSNVYAYRAIRIIAQSMGGLRWTLKKGKREVEAHPILDLLARPHPKMGGAAFTFENEAYLLISGNNYIVGVGPNGGAPRELWTLRPDRVVVRGGNAMEPVGAYEYRANGGAPQVFDPKQVLHMREFNPTDDWYGMGPVKPGSRSIDVDNDGRKWNKALVQNSANPSMLFLSEENVTDAQFDRLENQFSAGWAGSSNAGKIKLLEGGLKPHPISWSPKDMEWEKGSSRAAREIAVVFGVAPELIGDAANKTYSNYKEARKALYVETVIPRAMIRRDELNTYFDQWWPGYTLDVDLDAVEELHEDRAMFWTGLDASFANGTITRNENRVAKGYDEDAFDYYLVPLGAEVVEVGMSPLDVAPTPSIDPGNNPVDPNADPNALIADPNATDVVPPKDVVASKMVLKAFGLNTESKRVAFVKQIDQRRSRWIKSIQQAAVRRLSDQRKAIVSAIRNASSPEATHDAAEKAVLAQHPKWEKFYRNVYLTVGKDFATATLRGLKIATLEHARPGSEFEHKAVSIKAEDETWADLVDRWLRAHAGKKIQGITETDLKRVRRELAEGVKAGESTEQLAKRIDDYLEPIYANRAEAVARTEVIPASNLAGQMAARATGLPLVKSWIATHDARTRTNSTGPFDHLEAEQENQRISIDVPYTVGGEKLMFPGDTSHGASAENTIQCRCSEGYDTEGDD